MTGPTRRSLIAAATGGLALAASSAIAGSLPAMAANPATLNGSNWMRDLDGRTWMHNLTLPGTHDSCARFANGAYGIPAPANFIITQYPQATIAQQLAWGVRCFDLRVRPMRNSTFTMVHGASGLAGLDAAWDQKVTFHDVLDQISRFLDNHRSEMVVIHIQKEWHEQWEAWRLRQIYDRETRAYRSKIVDDGKGYSLNDLRGKIYVVSRTSGIPGLPWDKCTVADYYNASSPNEKWDRVLRDSEEHGVGRVGDPCGLEVARHANASSWDYYVTFCSNNNIAALNLPKLPIKQCAWSQDPRHLGVNYQLQRYLDRNRRYTPRAQLGMIMLDFANDWLVQEIAAWNYGRAYFTH